MVLFSFFACIDTLNHILRALEELGMKLLHRSVYPLTLPTSAALRPDENSAVIALARFTG
jgi:hypothetical protein